VATTITITVEGGQHTISTDGVASSGARAAATSEFLRVLHALKEGDFAARADDTGEDDTTAIELLNQIMAQHQQFAAELKKVAYELGTRGALGGKLELTRATGEWRHLVEHVNIIVHNLTIQLRAAEMPKLSGANEIETTIEVFDELKPGNNRP
jgi:hypothetical protein